jgi:hypothetical protein
MNLGIQDESYSSDVDKMMIDLVKMKDKSDTGVNFGTKSNKELKKGLLDMENTIEKESETQESTSEGNMYFLLN